MEIPQDATAGVELRDLLRLLSLGGETDSLDFKEEYDVTSARGRFEMARDIIAFANTEGGGHIVFGVKNKTWEPVGVLDDVELDHADLYNKVTKRYIDGDVHHSLATYHITADQIANCRWDWQGTRCFVIMYIPRCSGLAMTACDGNYQENGQAKSKFAENEIFVRRGSQTRRATRDDILRLGRSIPTIEDYIRVLGGRKSAHLRDLGSEHLSDLGSDGSPLIDHNLPAREHVTVRFVGREDTLRTLWAWLKDPFARTWMLTGAGGKGKTSIAYEFATQVAAIPTRAFAAIIWVTAKQRQLVAGKIEEIDSPDFWDRMSLCDALFRGYGFSEFVREEDEYAEKAEELRELLLHQPALVIVDDIDSLAREAASVVRTLTELFAETPSKLLCTSRMEVEYFRDVSTVVPGWYDKATGQYHPDGEEFVISRLPLYRLDQTSFPKSRIREILRVADGIPLYIEDLLRLARTIGVDLAIREWSGQAGATVREYALLREFQALSESAQAILLACCIPDGSVSLPEIRVITGVTDQEIYDALPEIQNLFLVSAPQLVKDDERYSVNSNTRKLILTIFGRERPETLRRFHDAYGRMTGQQDIRGHREIADTIRQVGALLYQSDYQQAEVLVQTVLTRFPDNPDLIGELGVIYSRWLPARWADARQYFARAAGLQCPREWMYSIWVQMELGLGEWGMAANAAEQGISRVGESVRLCYFAGYAYSRLGQEFKRALNAKAEQTLIMAQGWLEKALRDPSEAASYAERDLNSRVMRALAINCGELSRILQPDAPDASRSLGDQMLRVIDRWVNEYPQNPYVAEQTRWIRERYGGISSQ